MARTTTRIGRGALGLLAGLGAPLAAQTYTMPASDPVGISRAGAGVAFGQSLEAAALNPALLVTLRETSSAFVSMGMDMQVAQGTLTSNQNVLWSADRNRALPALGAAWRRSPTLTLGLKMDSPFMRHAQMPADYFGRFEAAGMKLGTNRLEFQAAWSVTPNLSLGASVGLTRVQYSFNNAVRIGVAQDPGMPISPQTNGLAGLMEVSLVQEATKALPSYTLGFRWAINPRWTLAGAYQGPIQGTLGLSAQVDASHATYVGTNGYGLPDSTTPAKGPAIAAASTAAPGNGSITLPGKLTLGLRQRMNQSFTWEADLRYVEGANLRLPGYATLTNLNGTVQGSGMPGELHSGFGLSLAGDISLTSRLTARLGLATDPGLRRDLYLEPVLGGSRTSTFAAGVGYRAFGGEVTLGWQTRQGQDREVRNLDGQWNASGLTPMGSLARVEGMGHLWSVGFKKAF